MQSNSGIDRWEQSFERRPWWTTLRGVIGGLVIVLIVVGLVGLFTTGSIFFQAAAAKKTLQPRIDVKNYDSNNVIQKQEMFQQLYADIQGYKSNIAIARQAYKAQPTSENQTNLVGVQQQCVNTVQQYNAEAKKITSRQWRSKSLPYQINSGGCK